MCDAVTVPTILNMLSTNPKTLEETRAWKEQSERVARAVVEYRAGRTDLPADILPRDMMEGIAPGVGFTRAVLLLSNAIDSHRARGLMRSSP